LILQAANISSEDKKGDQSLFQVGLKPGFLTVVAANVVFSERGYRARMPRTIAWRFTRELYRLHSLRSA
jgi:hypothetical protein